MLEYNSNYAHGTNIYVLFYARPRVGGEGKMRSKVAGFPTLSTMIVVLPEKYF